MKTYPKCGGDSIIMIRILSPTMISCDVTRLFNKFLKMEKRKIRHLLTAVRFKEYQDRYVGVRKHFKLQTPEKNTSD